MSKLYNRKTVKKSLKSVLSLEYLALRHPLFASFYKKYFYDKMLTREISFAEISENDAVAHIGSGPFPMTAITLAERKINVDCFDFNIEAVDSSYEYVKKMNLDDKIKIFYSIENPPNYKKYDVIIISFHVIDKNELIDNILKNCKKRIKIIYRNPSKIASLFYDAYYPNPNGSFVVKTLKLPFFKESVLIQKWFV